MRISDVRPTVFFVRGENGLRQMVRLDIRECAGASDAFLIVRWAGQQERFPLGSLSEGDCPCDICLPDIRQAMPVRLELWAGEAMQDARELTWQPGRHWELHVVHGSHHDLGYTDLPSNLLREHDCFLDQVICNCRETEDFPEVSRYRYSVEQAWSVLHFLENRPAEVAAEAARLMREGRIEVTALFGNETSELCSHEEQVRLLYPAFRLRRRFGIPIETAELNDVPGLSWGLVSVLAGAGIRFFAPGIPDYFRWGEKAVHTFWDEQAVVPRDMPGAFWWQGPDGSRVLFWYGGGLSLWDYQSALDEVQRSLARVEAAYPYDVIRYKFQGGHRDNSPPDVRLSLVAREWNQRWAYPRLIVSTNSAFFHRFEELAGASLRVLRGDLPNTDYTVGATSTAKETAVNRGAHETLAAGEKLAAFAATVTGHNYPADTIAEAYDQAMLYDEHTWGMMQPYGPAQEACFSQKGQTAYRAAALAQDVLSKAANRLADAVRLPDEGYHIVVFNPLSWARSDVVRGLFQQQEPCGHPMYWRQPEKSGEPAMLVCGWAEGRPLVHLPASLARQPFEVVDVETGRAVPCQVIELSDHGRPLPFASHRAGLADRDESFLYELMFRAEDVPACGYKTYRIVHGGTGQQQPTDLSVGDDELENAFYRIRVDRRTGEIASIYDKEQRRELVDQTAPHGFNLPVVRSPKDGQVRQFHPKTVERGAAGPLYASLIVRGEVDACPRVTQEIALYAGIKRVDVSNRVLRDATPLREVYFAFPFDLPKPQFRFEAPNSVVAPIVDQLPGSNTDCYCAQHWVSAWNEEVGITWSSVDAPVVVLSELWPGYVSQAHHSTTPPGYGHEFLRDAAQLEHGRIYSYALASNFRTNFSPVQPSDCLFRYSFTSHRVAKHDLAGPVRQVSPGSDGRNVGAVRFGWGAGNPLTPVYVQGPQGGSLPASASFCRVDRPNVLVLTVKAAEDGDGLIVRLYESEGEAGVARLELPHYEIGQAFATDLVEQDRAALNHDLHGLTVALPAFGLATVRLRGRRLPYPSHYAYY